ncbi:hypothetical protein BaRGS_00006349 [Batillaria attramentaria]|uniref:Uncharacterized protein n=1 Tax=Batillaria attramentaria TaxID=370345 RepID=A0ABD0LTK7_9CAEN
MCVRWAGIEDDWNPATLYKEREEGMKRVAILTSNFRWAAEIDSCWLNSKLDNPLESQVVFSETGSVGQEFRGQVVRFPRYKELQQTPCLQWSV